MANMSEERRPVLEEVWRVLSNRSLSLAESCHTIGQLLGKEQGDPQGTDDCEHFWANAWTSLEQQGDDGNGGGEGGGKLGDEVHLEEEGGIGAEEKIGPKDGRH